MELLVSLLFVLINVSITALNVKLYTEYFKDRSARARDPLPNKGETEHGGNLSKV